MPSIVSGVGPKAMHPVGTGPALLEDQVTMKIHWFDHECIPKCILHARDTGTRGRFSVFGGVISRCTLAPALTDPSGSMLVSIRF
jgi:catalase